MRQARRSYLLRSLVAPLLGAVAFSACASSPPPPVEAPPSPSGRAAASAVSADEGPLVEWPEADPPPSTAAAEPSSPSVPPASDAPAPAVPPLPLEPGVEAKLLDAPRGPSEPLRGAADLRWDGTRLTERPKPAPPARSPGAPPRVRLGSTEVRGYGASGASVSGGAAPDPMSARGSMWGSEVGDSFGAGGLGLSGVGEGGGGRGDGIGLGTVGTFGKGAGSGSGSGFGSGAGRLGGRPATGAPGAPGDGSARPTAQESGVRAGEWDDNANFLEFRRYLAREARGVPFHPVDLSSRRFLVVRDVDGKPVPNCEVTVSAAGRSLRLLTSSTGRAVLFPHAEGVVAPSVSATARCGAAGEATSAFSVDAPDGAVDLRLSQKRAAIDLPTVDVAFVLDTTGSMSEEIDAVKRTVQRVAQQLGGGKLRIRFALVEYKDRTDETLVRVHHMTRDATGFVTRIGQIRASGGGDMPEDVISGLRAGLTQVEWSRSSAVRIAFLIGDAPPKLAYGDGSYVDAMRAANRAGIVIHTIAASGMDDLGQAVWRQIAQYTGGTNLFVLRGGAGPQSVGAGDAKSSCGGTHEDFTTGNLDALITRKVQAAVSALDGDAMKIAGLGQDERAKPCAARISQN